MRVWLIIAWGHDLYCKSWSQRASSSVYYFVISWRNQSRTRGASTPPPHPPPPPTPPQYFKQGSPPPTPMLELAKVLLLVKNTHSSHFCNQFQAHAQILTSEISIVLHTRRHLRAYVYMCNMSPPKNSPPPLSSIFLLH